MGYQFDGENYVISDEMLGVLLDSEPYISVRKRLLQARLSSMFEYEKELVVARNQLLLLKKRRKEAEEQERLKTLARNDAR